VKPIATKRGRKAESTASPPLESPEELADFTSVEGLYAGNPTSMVGVSSVFTFSVKKKIHKSENFLFIFYLWRWHKVRKCYYTTNSGKM
jgi:hypothetical protein